MRGQIAATAADDRARDGLEQRALGGRDVIAAQKVDARRSLPPGSPRPPVEERGQLRLHVVEIAGALVVDDDDVGGQPLQAPVLLRLQHLSCERQGVGADDLHEHDRQITGDAVPPESGLTELVRRQPVARRAQRPVGEQHTRREALEQDRIAIGDRQVMQRALRMPERERKRPHRGTGFAVLLREGERGVPIARDAGGEAETHRRPRSEPDALPQAEDRIEDDAGRPGQRAAVDRRGGARITSAPQEPGPVRLPLDRPCVRPSRLSTCTAQRGLSPASRGRRWHSRAELAGTYSVSRNSLPNAG